MTTRTADLGLYVAAGAALAGGAGLALADLPAASEGWRHVVAAGVLVAALGKAAQLPFSFWLSRAMEGPSPVSALLHSAAMVAMGGYLLLRTEPLLASTGWAAPAAAWVGALTALVLGAVAVAQQDLKQLLAASTSAQLGFVVMGAGLASVSGGAAHLVAHASTKALLFLAAGAWLTALGTKQLAGLRGVARRWRLVGWAATVGALSLAGVAPLALWATKDAVLAAALEESAVALRRRPRRGRALGGLRRQGPGDPVATAARAGNTPQVEAHLDEEEQGTRHVGMLRADAAGRPRSRRGGPRRARAAAVRRHGRPRSRRGAAPPDMGGDGRVGRDRAGRAGARVVASRCRSRAGPLAWLGLGRATQALVVRPTLALAEALARFDDRVLDRGVAGSAAAALGLARRAATFDDRVLDGAVETTSRASLWTAARAARDDDRWFDGAVEGLAAQLRRLGRLARRPQTGQLHQYYIQAVAVLAIGVLLLVTVR